MGGQMDSIAKQVKVCLATRETLSQTPASLEQFEALKPQGTPDAAARLQSQIDALRKKEEALQASDKPAQKNPKKSKKSKRAVQQEEQSDDEDGEKEVKKAPKTRSARQSSKKLR